MSSIHVTHHHESALHFAGRRTRHHLARRAFRTLWQWLDRTAQRSALSELDDHLLRDIGKTRWQAEAERRKPFWSA